MDLAHSNLVILIKDFLISAFKEYGADYCDSSYIASSASGVRQCSKFSVTPMYKTAVHSTAAWVVSDLHKHVGKLPGSYSSTFAVG